MPLTTAITLEGRPGHSAALARAKGSAHIDVTLTTPAGARTHQVRAADRGDLWRTAEILQHALDEFRGCGGDVRDFMRPLELMSDL